MRRFLAIFISIATLLTSQLLDGGMLDIPEMSTHSEEISAELDYDHSATPISLSSGSQTRVPSTSRRALSSLAKIYLAHNIGSAICENILSSLSNEALLYLPTKLSAVFKWHQIRI